MSAHLGREAISQVALALFADQGIDGVSLRDIHRESGHRNRSATAYHFGSKDDLVRALTLEVIDAHDLRRTQTLGELLAQNDHPTLAQLTRAGLSPMIDDLATPVGRQRLRFMAHVTSDTRYLETVVDALRSTRSVAQLSAMVASHLTHLPEDVRAERIEMSINFGVTAFANRARAMEMASHLDAGVSDESVATGASERELEAFGSHVLVMLEAMLMAPDPAAS